MGIFLREFTHGHTSQLSAVLRRHLVALAEASPLLEGIKEQAFVDIDSLLRPVYGHAKQGAWFGHTKIAGRQSCAGACPRSRRRSAPVPRRRWWPGYGYRAGRAGSARGAASMVTEAVNTAKAAGATNILVRGDSAYGNGKVIAAVLQGRSTVLGSCWPRTPA